MTWHEQKKAHNVTLQNQYPFLTQVILVVRFSSNASYTVRLQKSVAQHILFVMPSPCRVSPMSIELGAGLGWLPCGWHQQPHQQQLGLRHCSGALRVHDVAPAALASKTASATVVGSDYLAGDCWVRGVSDQVSGRPRNRAGPAGVSRSPGVGFYGRPVRRRV